MLTTQLLTDSLDDVRTQSALSAIEVTNANTIVLDRQTPVSGWRCVEKDAYLAGIVHAIGVLAGISHQFADHDREGGGMFVGKVKVVGFDRDCPAVPAVGNQGAEESPSSSRKTPRLTVSARGSRYSARWTLATA
jgi:hypothetical protein